MGAKNAVKNFNPVETINSIGHNLKDGLKFLSNFVIDLGLDQKQWLEKYSNSEKIKAICQTIENSSTEQIGEVIGHAVVDQILFDKTLKLVGQSLSLLAGSVTKSIKENSKIHEILSNLKDASTFSQAELEVLAASEAGPEIMLFKDTGQEITKDLEKLSNFNSNSHSIINHANLTVEQVSKLSEFNSGVAQLTAKYGQKVIEDAKQALKITEYKILKNDHSELLKNFEKLAADIKYIQESKRTDITLFMMRSTLKQ